MRALVVSDLHGDLEAVEEAIERFRPDALLGCGDWGDSPEVAAEALGKLVNALPTASTFGNHDPMTLLRSLRDSTGERVLIDQGQTRVVAGLRVAAIGGIWATSHRKPHYVTDDDVRKFAQAIAATGPVDVLLTHGCPVGLADLTASGRHGGQRCFLEAFRTIKPRVHLCGHLHVAQTAVLKDGRKVVNVGATPEGRVVIIETEGPGIAVRAERFERPV